MCSDDSRALITIEKFLIMANMKKLIFIFVMLTMLASCGRGEKTVAPSDTIVADTVAIDTIL